MGRETYIIEDIQKVSEILEECTGNKTVFEAVDHQNNLFSLGLLKLNCNAPEEQVVWFQKRTGHLLAEFAPLQKGTAEMQVNCDYGFSFHCGGKIYSFNGRLISADPTSFVLTYIVECKLYRHQIRTSDRVSVEMMDRVSARIGNKVYPLFNISLGGIGIIVNDPESFQIGQELPVKLFSDAQIFEATGSVKHVAPLSDAGFICGVSLAYHNQESLEHIEQFIQQTHLNRTNLCKLNLLLR